jgi:hypothetical protein
MLTVLLALSVPGMAIDLMHESIGTEARTPPKSGPAHVTAAGVGLDGALARCNRLLGTARERMARQPGNGDAALEVAALEMCRSGLLVLAAYEDQSPTDYSAWRQALLRTDPDGGLQRAARAARAALQTRLDPHSRRQALLLLAAARARMGDHRGEALSLAEAAWHEPDRPELWLRLAEAWGRGRRFARAEAVRARGLALLRPAPRGAPEMSAGTLPAIRAGRHRTQRDRSCMPDCCQSAARARR